MPLTRELGDVARLRSGKADLDVRAHDLSLLLPELLSRHSGEIDVDRIRITAPAGPLPIAADAGRLDQILANLLTIALSQNTGQAEIDLQVSAAEDKVHFTLTAHSESPSGAPWVPSDDAMGLGLLVARFLVGCHGGELEVGQGSTNNLVLRFWLPLLWKP